VALTSADPVRVVLHNFREEGHDSMYPRYTGGRLPRFAFPSTEITRIAQSARKERSISYRM
jgi:hypothetical protein